MSVPLLRLQGVGKDYAKVDSGHGRLRLVFDLLRGRGVASVFRALDDVSVEMRPGESLGIVGENGAGKSTLLKIVAGVAEPTRGRVEVNGRVGALLELGSGFHPEYTGLANIELAAALLGLSPREIAGKRDQIIAFADIGEHIGDPIKTYSSGMVVRLGFAIPAPPPTSPRRTLRTTRRRPPANDSRCPGPWRPLPASTRSSPSSSCRMSGSCRGIRSRCARKCTRRTGAFRSC